MTRNQNAAWRRVLLTLAANPGVTGKQLAALSGVKLETVAPYISVTKGRGSGHLVHKEGHGGALTCRASSADIMKAASLSQLIASARNDVLSDGVRVIG